MKEIREAVASSQDVYELENAEALAFVDAVAKSFIADADKTWWWDSIKQKSLTISYGNDDCSELLNKLIKNKRAEVLLIVTDEESRPWPVFRGAFSDVSKIISEQRFFEYFITNRECTWLIFDTHHNSLVLTGEMIDVFEALRD